jgi:chitin synthase
MLQVLAFQLYKIIPNFLLRWRTNSLDVRQHKIYCEKLVIVIMLLILYAVISYLFVYESWLRCTNIIDIINNADLSAKIYKTKIFHRENTFCNTMDGFLVVYISFLSATLFTNIVLGILFNYYRKYKDSKTSKDPLCFDDKIIVHIPLYNEDYNTIKSTIDSVSRLNYCKDNILMLIVIDGIIMSKDKYGNESTTDYTLLHDVLDNEDFKYDFSNGLVYNNCIQYKDNKLKIYNGEYSDISYSVIVKCGNDLETIKKGNRGKKDSALIIYETIYYMCKPLEITNSSYSLIIQNINEGLVFYKKLNEYGYMLIIDCDTDAEPNSLIQLLNYLHININCIAVCGETVVKNNRENYITIVQSFEYFISHLLLKTFENLMYRVLVLSGCFTLFRLKQNDEPTINTNIISKYTKEAEGIYERNLLDLGEDRYLTILIIQEYPTKHLAYISEAKSYTNVPNTFNILIDQRRRWTNSLITCLILLATKPPRQNIIKHLSMYLIITMELFIIFLLPLVIVIGLINSVISITIQGYSLLPVVITVIIILINFIITVFVVRIDMMIRFVPFFTYLPVFSIIIPLYSIINLDNLKWGLTRDTVAIVNSNENIDALEIDREYRETLTPSNNITILA